MAQTSSDDSCPTCHRPTDMATDLVNELDKKGFFAGVEKKIVDAVTPTLIKAGAQSASSPGLSESEVKKAIQDSLQGIEFKPTIKMTHHGVKDLADCPTCSKELSGLVKKAQDDAVTAYKQRILPLVRARVGNR